MTKRFDTFARICLLIAGISAIANAAANGILHLAVFGAEGVTACLLGILCAATPAVFSLILALNKKPGFTLCAVALAVVLVNPIGIVLSPMNSRVLSELVNYLMSSRYTGTVTANWYVGERNLMSQLFPFFIQFFFIGAGVKLVTSWLEGKTITDRTSQSEE